MLIETTLYELIDKVHIAIERFKTFEPKEGYYLAFSGGKDSVVIYRLAEMSGAKFDAHYNLTTVDPPELVRFIRKQYPLVQVHRPDKTMWQLIVKLRMPPTRIVRYCCENLKERGGADRLVVTGIRWEESAKRSKRRMVEPCKKHSRKTYIHPIIDWTAKEVWQFIHENNVPCSDLYNKGYRRIGCILCPMQTAWEKKRDMELFPKYATAYKHAFQRMIDKRRKDGLETQWTTGQEVFDWWITDKHKQDDDGCWLFE